MKNPLLTAGIVLFTTMLPLKGMAASFSQFFVFGDSLSDPGNLFNVTFGAIPQSPPYFQGRFSNGRIWSEFLGDELNLNPTLVTNLSNTVPTQGVNFAFGGSTSGEGNAFIPGVPGVRSQVNLFLANQPQVDPNALYAVWGGGNDYLFGDTIDVNQTVTNLTESVTSLAQAGARNILVFNLPDLGKIPFALASGNSTNLSLLTAAHNAGLAASLSQFNTNPNLNIVPVDVNSLFNRVIAAPGEFGFNNVTGSCLVGDFAAIALGNFSLCNNPNDFLFFDAVHPSTNAHRLIASTTLSNLSVSVPEPTTSLGMVALVAMGTISARRKRRRVGRV